MKKNIILLLSLVLLITGCQSKNERENEKKLTNPDINIIVDSIKNVEEIKDICVYTEESDTNNLLHKDGGYTNALSFSLDKIDLGLKMDDETYEDRPYKDSCEKGTAGGGTIEIFKTKEEAEKRNEYLSKFDGSVINSGSHIIMGTMIIRISNELTKSEQETLQEKITNSIKEGLDLKYE